MFEIATTCKSQSGTWKWPAAFRLGPTSWTVYSFIKGSCVCVCVWCVRAQTSVLGTISQKRSIFGLLIDCFCYCLFLRQDLSLVWNLWIRLVWMASKPWDLPVSVSPRTISMSHHIWLFYMGFLNQIQLLQKWFVWRWLHSLSLQPY